MSEAVIDNSRLASIGIILVHGIGEQRRFEHLDWQGRDIIRAIKQQPDIDITVEIGADPAGTFHAEQDTWDGGPSGPVHVFVRTAGQLTHCLHFHEVWWADVNERYSLAKQIRFWLWGLAVWAYPAGSSHRRDGMPKDPLQGAAWVVSPNAPGVRKQFHRLCQRARLFLVGVVFLIGAFSVGIGALLIQRLFNLKTPALLKILANYVSGVKLFNQRSRYGPGFVPPPANEDFLDTLDEPPRVSVRRRMIRTIATVAQANYDCWYIVAHSQGTVAAFNGLMETPNAWPGYFNSLTWRAFCAAGFGGRGVMPPGTPPAAPTDSMPRRPVWAMPDEVAYRKRIFGQFRGLLTLGSPLEKAAAIWPARVPIACMEAFRKNTVWINVFDPLDPVSGVLEGFDGHPETICPKPANVGYAAYPVLLLAHLRYVTWTRPRCLADGVAHWLLTGTTTRIFTGSGRFENGSVTFRRRRLWAYAWWALAFLVLSLLGGWALRGTIGAISSLLVGSPPCDCAQSLGFAATVAAALCWLSRCDLLAYVVLVIGIGIIGTMLVGLFARWRKFRGDEDAPEPPTDRGPISDVDPSPPGLLPWPPPRPTI